METKTAEFVDGILKRGERQRAIQSAVESLRRQPKRTFWNTLPGWLPLAFWIWLGVKTDFYATIEGKRVVSLEGMLYIVMVLLMTSSVVMTLIPWRSRHDRLLLLLSEEVMYLKEELNKQKQHPAESQLQPAKPQGVGHDTE